MAMSMSAREESQQSRRLEDADTARLVARAQAGDREAFGRLYERYFERVFGYLRVVLKDSHEAEDLAQSVFVRLLERIESYERRRQPFRAWLFTVVRNLARDFLAEQGRIEVTDPAELDARLEAMSPVEADLQALSWVGDPDLLYLIERLPLPQRQVMVLRFMLDLPAREIARVLGLSPNHVAVLQYRAIGYIRERLTSLGREPRRADDAARMTRTPQKSTVLRHRRFALE